MFDNKNFPPEIAVLRNAIKILKRNGWCQNSFGFPGGPRCAAAAVLDSHVSMVIGVTEDIKFTKDTNAALNALDKALGPRRVDGINKLPLWNDAPGRTIEDVIDLFERVANHLELEFMGAVV